MNPKNDMLRRIKEKGMLWGLVAMIFGLGVASICCALMDKNNASSILCTIFATCFPLMLHVYNKKNEKNSHQHDLIRTFYDEWQEVERRLKDKWEEYIDLYFSDGEHTYLSQARCRANNCSSEKRSESICNHIRQIADMQMRSEDKFETLFSFINKLYMVYQTGEMTKDTLGTIVKMPGLDVFLSYAPCYLEIYPEIKDEYIEAINKINSIVGIESFSL